MSHPVLKAKPTLTEIQTYVEAVVKHRGFSSDTLQDNFIMLTEEIGELAKALRKKGGVKTATDSDLKVIEHETADVLWMLICVCNQLNIDLELAFRDKEAHNKKRAWV